MALTGTPAPPAPSDGPRPPFLGPTGPRPLIRASVAGQAATFVVVTLAIALVWGAVGSLSHAALPIGSLAIGVGIGVATAVGDRLERFPGLVVALITFCVTGLLVGLTSAAVPPEALAVFPFLALGLDWRFVSRLRLLPFLAGLAILGPVGTGEGWAYPAAVAWLALAVGALWILQNDERAGLDRPAPLGGPPDGGPPARPVDLVRTLGLALLAGLALAFLIGNPSCSGPDADINPPDIGADRSNRPAEPGEVPPERGFGEPGPGGGPGRGGAPGDTSGGEREIKVDADGQRYVEDPVTGERYDVTEQGGREVITDGSGRTIAEIDRDGSVTSYDDAGSQRYETDEDGRLYVETEGGERLYVEETPGGDVVLRDGDGDVVARGDASDDHLYVEDPDGDTLVPDPDGDGRIPIPNGGVRDGLPGSDGGTTYRRDGDRTIATDRDGERRTYDEDFVGRPRVTVEREGEDDRTYVYDGTGPYRSVLEYDEDGRLIKRYRYDPDGVTVDDDPVDYRAEGAGGSDGGGQDGQDGQGGSAGQDQDPAQDQQGDDGDPPPWGTIGLIALAVAAAVGLGIFLWRRRTPPTELRVLPWAAALVAAISAHGAVHGRRRGRSESIAAYCTALSTTVLPDPRLALVGGVLSAAFFAPEPPTAGEQAWAEAVVAEIVEAHPPPGRSERKAAAKAHAAAGTR